jgi:hypothetical protein
MRLLLLCDTYILHLDRLREAIFKPSNGIDPAKLDIYTDDNKPTTLRDDEAITGWHRLRDVAGEHST